MKNKKTLFLFAALTLLLNSGCVAFPPLITVHQKEADGLRSRVESLEKRVERLENQKPAQ